MTRRLARAAQVSGRLLYGCRNEALFLAFVLLSAVASLSGLVFTNGCSDDNTSAAAMNQRSDREFRKKFVLKFCRR